MRSLNSKKRLTWRSMPVLLAGLLAGSLLVQPAVAHVKKSLSHLTKHLDPRYYNVGEKVGDADTLDGIDSSGFARAGAAPSAHNHDDRYFTEAESDARYYNVGEKVGDADTLDGFDSAEFVQNGGIKLVVLKPWQVWPSAGVTIDSSFFGFTIFSAAAAAADKNLILVPDIPVTLYGKSLELTGMQLCYDAQDANAVLDQVMLFRSYANNGNVHNNTFVVDDMTDRDDSTCRTYTGTPQVLAPNAFAMIQLVVDWTGAGNFNVNRTTLFLQPHPTEAGPLRQAEADVRRRI